ncbi:hypothetical protein [Clostridium tetani]|uniref:hypothetical protein n=1 Tax=Clostridium tetani TaxID=1513 RepID=UPI000513B8EB|nr:hypothetical protein [Clostridium tetani]KGI44798.1 hypothetical protein KY55_02165 [Clostridium tetani]RXI73866.1 hypothetical protein DP127_04950 [Clostridium tetani]RXM58517.1 hypothetical protein DP133_04835 [Clostridium tetani]BDR87307.1 hypothetical protein N071400001_19150 [Clostridium tetani]
MYLLLFLLIVILILLLLLNIYPVKIIGNVNSYEIPDFNILFSWLYPFLKGTIVSNNGDIYLDIYIFNKKIYKRPLKNKNNGNIKNLISMLRQLKPDYAELKTSYSFTDPSNTGVTYGIINLLSQYINFDVFHNNPDFNMEEDYFNITTIMKFKTLAIIKLLNINRKNYNKKFSYESK